jgi:putative pyoverdin transport system ATP-binding/permease protein
MRLWEFLRTHSSVSLPRVVVIAAISGLANALLLGVVNSGAHSVADRSTNTRMFILFIIAITVYILTQRSILRTSSREVEKIIERLRVNLLEKIRGADLQALEGLGRAQIYASVNRDTLTISQAATPLMIACQGAILVLFSLIYIFLLSRTGFFLTIAIVGIGIAIHFKNKKELAIDMAASSTKENEFFEGLTHVLEGFKEVKLHRARSRDLSVHLKAIAAKVAALKTTTGLRYADYYIFTQVLFYLLIGAMVFILPRLSEVYADQVTRITAAILFIIGPLTMVVSLIPVVRAADHAVHNIARVEQALDSIQSAEGLSGDSAPVRSAEFKEISVRAATFSYRDSRGQALFSIGPIDFTLPRGEIVMIVGGNGSGKSTFLKVLTGLYVPDTGGVYLDRMDIGAYGRHDYRELFSAIFSDYHLFDRLYGLAGVDDFEVHSLLERMQLQAKTTWHKGRFLNQELSTGQRKRLALIVSLLEDKPIYVFDEWAADQDPSFRRFFYETLLPELKARGKTIVAATHDDRYFHLGDRVVKMEQGQFLSVTPGVDA